MNASAGAPPPETTTSGIPDPPLPFTGGPVPVSEAERRLVEQRVMAQFFVAPALSLAALGGGVNLGWPKLAAGGIVGLGLSSLATGLLAIGVAALALGLIEWLAPQFFRAGFVDLFGNPWPFDSGGSAAWLTPGAPP